MSTNTAGLSRKKVTLAMGFAIAGGVLIITSSLLALLTLPSIEEEITGLGIRDPRLMEEELITDYLSTTLTLGLISGIIIHRSTEPAQIKGLIPTEPDKNISKTEEIT